MSTQKRISGNNRKDEELDVDSATVSTAEAAAVAMDVDSMLNEIDEVLEQNAEEFVKSFIQKGGQ
jgi:ubiquitin-like protein Pup